MNWKSPLQWKISFLFAVLMVISLWVIWRSKSPQEGFAGALFLFVILVFLAVGWVAVGRIVTQPLIQMIGVVEKFAEGLFNWRVHPGGRNDELGRLGKDLNRMAQAIGEKVDQLSKNLAETEALLSGMEEGVLILELNGRIKKINQAMGAILPQTYPSDVGKHYLEVFRDPELNELIQETLAAKQGQRRTLSPLSQPGRSFHLQSSLIQDTKSGVGGVIVVFHDVTELKRLERIRQDFVANVSHELRTPLTAIKGYVEALCDDGLQDPVQAEQFLRVIQRHTDRMDKIVSDLLLLSAMESPDRVLKRESLLLPEVIHTALDSLRPMAEGKRQKIHVQAEQSLPSIQADGQKIHQVLINLLHNAISYTPEGGAITVEAKPVPEGVEIAVADNGIGIPPEDLSRIFERFYRVDKGRSREMGGTGLGLSIVKHVVERMGGTVSVDSRLGKGSTFVIVLPGVS